MANCPHGFPQDECLICQTLGVRQPEPATKAAQAKAKVPSTVLVRDDEVARPLPARRATQAEVPANRQRASGKTSVMVGLVLIVVGGLLVWAFGGLFRLAFHIFEYSALSIVAGWVGYRLGHWRGQRDQHERPAS